MQNNADEDVRQAERNVSRMAVWKKWAEMVHAPEGASQWLAWAVSRFPCMYDGPHPWNFASVEDWIPKFDTWGSKQSNSITVICGYILAAYNSSRLWKCRKHGYKSLADAAKNWDNNNRRGVAALIIGAKGI